MYESINNTKQLENPYFAVKGMWTSKASYNRAYDMRSGVK